MNRRRRTIHWKDALALLETKTRCSIKVWELSTGNILEYDNVICIGMHRRGGTHRVLFPRSGEIRAFRDVTLFEINGMEVYR